MPISRFLAFTFQNRSRASLNLLRGFGSSRRFRFHNYTGAPKYNKKNLDGQTLVPEKPLDSHSWSWHTFILPAGLLVVAGAGIYLHYNDEKRVILKGQDIEHVRNNISGPTIGGPFTLVDTENHVVTEHDFPGNWVLLYFGYTSSPDVGPKEVQKMAEAIDILEQDSEQNLKIIPVFITIDPKRDTPSQLQAYLKEFDPRIIGLTGPISAIRQMAQEYRVYFRKVEEDGDDYLVESSHTMYLLNPIMEIVRCFGVEYNAEQLSKEILKEINRTSK